MSLSSEIKIFILSAVPFFELRLSVPLAIALGFSGLKTFFLACSGNFIPIIPLMLVLPYVEKCFLRYNWFQKVYAFFHRRTTEKGLKMQKYGLWGLFLFVAIPIPGTGVYTGAFLAFLFNLDKRKALFALTSGMLTAGLLMVLASSGIKGLHAVSPQLGLLLIIIVLVLLVLFIIKKKT